MVLGGTIVRAWPFALCFASSSRVERIYELLRLRHGERRTHVHPQNTRAGIDPHMANRGERQYRRSLVNISEGWLQSVQPVYVLARTLKLYLRVGRSPVMVVVTCGSSPPEMLAGPPTARSIRVHT